MFCDVVGYLSYESSWAWLRDSTTCIPTRCFLAAVRVNNFVIGLRLKVVVENRCYALKREQNAQKQNKRTYCTDHRAIIR
jgi:hypothetical protein